MNKFFRVFSAVFLLISASPLIAASEQLPASSSLQAVDKLPCGPADPARESSRRQQLDPTAIVKLSLGPTRLEIPWAHLMPRPFTTRTNCPNDLKFFGFQFWVPSLRAPEEDQRFLGTHRPAELRSDRASDDLVVKVIEVTSYDPAGFPQRSPTDKRIENLIQLRLISKMPPLSKAQISDLAELGDEKNYRWYLTTPNTSVLFQCAVVGKFAPCRGRMSIKDLQTEALFDFPMDALWRHEEIALGVETLLKRWRK